jgi:hypothetical protein
LRYRGRGDLNGAIQKFGGLRTVAATLGHRYEGRQSWESVNDPRNGICLCARHHGAFNAGGSRTCEPPSPLSGDLSVRSETGFQRSSWRPRSVPR